MPPKLPPYRVASTPIATSLVQSMERQWQSPYAQEVGEAAALIAGGEEVKAAFLLRQVIRTMEDRGYTVDDREPVLRLTADAWGRAALRFVSNAADYTPGVRQYLRVDFLSEALTIYTTLEDVPNRIRIHRALAAAHLSLNHPKLAADELRVALDLAQLHEALSPQEMRQLLAETISACKSLFDRYPRAKIENAMKVAAFYQLLGDSAQAMVYLEKIQARILENAKVLNQRGKHHSALVAASQATVLGIIVGREDVLARYADLLMRYAISNGDTASAQIYDRAIHLAQSGMQDLSSHMIEDRAKMLLVLPSTGKRAIEVFHTLIDVGVKYLSGFAKSATQSGNYQDPKILDAANALMEATYWQNDALRRTIELMEPLVEQPLVEALVKDWLIQLKAGVDEHSRAVSWAAKHYRATQRPIAGANPALILTVAETSLDHPEALQRLYMEIARDMNCSIAEAESLFTPYGDTQLQGRLREALGELAFAHLRSKAIRHDLNVRNERWDRFIREKSLKK